MNIMIATTIVLFERDETDDLIDNLSNKLREHGHDTTTLRIPFHAHYESLFEQMLAMRMIDVSHQCDRLVCMKPPAYLVRHSKKTIWLSSELRAEDYWGLDLGLPYGFDASNFREHLIRAEEFAFGGAKRIIKEYEKEDEQIDWNAIIRELIK